jgi:hypothetical protein
VEMLKERNMYWVPRTSTFSNIDSAIVVGNIYCELCVARVEKVALQGRVHSHCDSVGHSPINWNED